MYRPLCCREEDQPEQPRISLSDVIGNVTGCEEASAAAGEDDSRGESVQLPMWIEWANRTSGKRQVSAMTDALDC